MTEQQQRAYAYIRGRLTETGIAPSFSEIQRHLGLASKSGVHRLLNTLLDQGVLVKRPGRARSLALPGIDLSTISTEALVAELGKRGLVRG